MDHARMIDVIQRTTGVDWHAANGAAKAIRDELRNNGEIIVDKQVYDAATKGKNERRWS